MVQASIAWRRRGAPGGTPLALLAIAAAVWQVGYALELGLDDRSVKLIWAKIQYVGIASIPTLWLAITLQYTDRGLWLTRRTIAFLTIGPLVAILLAATNGSHGLIWSTVSLETTGSLPVLSLTHGVGFWVHARYSYLLILLGIIFLADRLLQSHRLYWEQAVALMISALLPWAANWSFMAGLRPGDVVDMTPFAFIGSVAILLWALFRTKLLDVVPVARELVFGNMRDGVLVLDSIDRVVDFNLAAERLAGKSGDRLIGHSLAEVWSDGSELIDRASEQAPRPVRYTIGQEEAQCIYDVSLSALRDRRGGIAGRLMVFHDVTQLWQEEERLKETSRLASIGEMASGVAHEINNPLMVIVGNSELLIDQQVPAPIRERVRVIHSQANRSAKIVRNLLSFARRQESDKRYLDVQRIVEHSLELKAYDLGVSNVRVLRQWPTDLPLTMVDEHQLEQVMMNIVTNAEQAMTKANGGGELKVGAAIFEDKIRISISDTGHGIPPEHLNRVFEPFFTTKAVGEGTGLGLSTCHGILHEHGGDIWVRARRE